MRDTSGHARGPSTRWTRVAVRRGPQRQTDLVRLLGSDAATMTRTIQRLENAGFVYRRPSPSDKRAAIVEPTAASSALRQEVERAWLDLEASVVNDLTPKEQAVALEVLSRIEDSVSDWLSDPIGCTGSES
ncbi:MarR family winged helix-turn-helix transcriptional regulator [Streptomyces himalayensis]|nr:MarR family winged helix-turn-helix transcriptional regulator [Streptomyces himalayensis]